MMRHAAGAARINQQPGRHTHQIEIMHVRMWQAEMHAMMEAREAK